MIYLIGAQYTTIIWNPIQNKRSIFDEDAQNKSG